MTLTPPSEPLDNPRAETSAAPTWRTWAVAAALTAVVVGVGIVAMGGGGDDNAAVSAAQTDQSDQTDGTTDTGPGGQPGGFGRGASGEVTQIDDGVLTLEAIDQSGAESTMTVETNADTTVTETVEAALGDLAVGDNVLVTGEETDGGVEATSISETDGAGFGSGGGPPGGGGPPDGADRPDGVEPPEGFDPGNAPQGGGFPGGFTIGEITAIDGSTLTVETAEGESTTVTTTDATTVTVTEDRSVDVIAVGDTIRAIGETDGSVVTATSIQLGDLGVGAFGGGGPPGVPPATDDDSTS